MDLCRSHLDVKMNLVLLTSALALCFWQIRSQLLSSPMNTIANIGQRVEFECSTNAALPLIWDFAEVNSTRFEFIYFNEAITSKFSSRYKVNSSMKGRWALVIDSVDFAYAGTYRCQNTQNYDQKERTTNASAQLVVIDSDPLCDTNTSTGDTVEGDYIRMWCTFNYMGNWQPVMEYTRNNGLTVYTDTQYTYESRKVTSSLIMQLAWSDNSATFTCKMSLNPHAAYRRPPRAGDTQATNIPHYQCSWNYTANVLYGPRNMTIEPIGDIYKIGDRLICSADGNPSPKFQWTEIRTAGPILTIDKTLELVQKVTFTCTACNRVAGKMESISENVTFAITATPASLKPGIIVLTVSGVIAGIGLVILGLGVMLTWKACAKANSVNRKRSQESSVQPQDYEMVDESTVKSGGLGKPSLNQPISKKEIIEHHAAETIACEGYDSLKRSSSCSVVQPAVYAELQQYANTDSNNGKTI